MQGACYSMNSSTMRVSGQFSSRPALPAPPGLRGHLPCCASSPSCKTGLFFCPSREGRPCYVGQQIRASRWLHIVRQTRSLPLPETTAASHRCLISCPKSVDDSDDCKDLFIRLYQVLFACCLIRDDLVRDLGLSDLCHVTVQVRFVLLPSLIITLGPH